MDAKLSLPVNATKTELQGGRPAPDNVLHMATPKSFSWRNNRDVQALGLYPNFHSSMLVKPVNQNNCGSCWSVATVTMFADRWSIANGRKCPPLNVSDVLTCAEPQNCKELGCGGGNVHSALEFIVQAGVGIDKTGKWLGGYEQWCGARDDKKACQKNIPTCCGSALCSNNASAKPPPVRTIMSRCAKMASRKGRVYRGLPRSIIYLSEGNHASVIERMKQHLVRHGPIVTQYRVFMDNYVPSFSGQHYPETNGIYIHDERKSPYASNAFFTGLASASTRSQRWVASMMGITSSDSSDSVKKKVKAYLAKSHGQHSVVIVGYGEADAGPVYGKIPYWEIRNSWGATFNGDGYFKVAMSDPRRKINLGLGIDKSLVGFNGTIVLGALTCLATTSTSDARYVPSPQSPTTKSQGSHVSSPGHWPAVTALLLGLVLAVVILVIPRRQSRSPTAFPVNIARPFAGVSFK